MAGSKNRKDAGKSTSSYHVKDGWERRKTGDQLRPNETKYTRYLAGTKHEVSENRGVCGHAHMHARQDLAV